MTINTVHVPIFHSLLLQSFPFLLRIFSPYIHPTIRRQQHTWFSQQQTTLSTIEKDMEANMLPLALLTQQSKQWSATVLLVKKSHRHKTKMPGKEFQHYIFVDHAETKIPAICYTPDIPIVDTVLLPLQTYIISNAKVVPCNI